MDLKKGSVVYSISGSDKGKVFLVVRTEGEYSYIADGILRKVDKPKKKKNKHLQKTNRVFEIGDEIENYQIREILKTL